MGQFRWKKQHAKNGIILAVTVAGWEITLRFVCISPFKYHKFTWNKTHPKKGTYWKSKNVVVNLVNLRYMYIVHIFHKFIISNSIYIYNMCRIILYKINRTTACQKPCGTTTVRNFLIFLGKPVRLKRKLAEQRPHFSYPIPSMGLVYLPTWKPYFTIQNNQM